MLLKSIFTIVHRVLEKFFHIVLLETAICGHLFRYKVEIIIFRIVREISTFHILPIVAFFSFFHVTVTSFST